MLSDIQQYELVFGCVEGATTAFEFARGSHRQFVRSQFQIAYDSPEATGSRISALDALLAFGWEKMAEIGEQGVAVLSRDLKSVPKSFQFQLKSAGLGFDDVASRAGWSDEEKISFVKGGRAPIRLIQQFATILGFDERSIGSARSRQPDADVAYRMRMFGQDNAVQFSTNLKLILLEASWIIERQSALLTMLEEGNVLRTRSLKGANYIDDDYGSFRVSPWMRGFSLAHYLRGVLGIDQSTPIPSMRRLIEEQFGIPVILVSYPGKFAGATIQTNGVRGIVINISGIKGSSLTRRSTLAHELCHILFDAEGQLKSLHVDFDEDMADFNAAAHDDVEKRANAFAVEFLAPRPVVQEAYASSYNKPAYISDAIATFGISAGAIRRHIANGLKCNVSDIAEPAEEPNIDEWKVAENSLTDYFPSTKRITSQRLGSFAYYIALCEMNKFVSIDSAAIMLDCEIKDTKEILDAVLELHQSGL